MRASRVNDNSRDKPSGLIRAKSRSTSVKSSSRRYSAALLTLAVLYTLYLAQTLFVPILVALLLALLLNPAVNALRRAHIPRTVGGLALLTALFVPLSLLGMNLAAPAQKWLERIPEVSAFLVEELESIEETLTPETDAEVETEQNRKSPWFGFFGSAKVVEPEPEPPSAVSEHVMLGGMQVALLLLSATPLLIAQFLTVLILTIFLLVFGPRLYEAAIEQLPLGYDKQQMQLLGADTQKELSRYILTVSVINSLLGVSVATALWLAGVEDAILWGVMVGMLNFAPYVGPVIGLAMLAIAGLVQFGLNWAALLPALLYFCINLLEAQFVTPLVLGRHMRLNPLVLMLWLIVLAWLWGAVGVLLAVPLLVCMKLVADHVEVLQPWVKWIETRG